MFEEFDRIFGRMPHRLFEAACTPEGCGPAAPVIYGYQIVVGPDGKPSARVFGGPTTPGNREIQVDTILDEKKKEIKMVAEIPGVEKSDINVTLEDAGVAINAVRGQTKYHTVVPLEYEVKSDGVKASYRNGILEIVFGLEDEPKGKSVRVD